MKIPIACMSLDEIQFTRHNRQIYTTQYYIPRSESAFEHPLTRSTRRRGHEMILQPRQKTELQLRFRTNRCCKQVTYTLLRRKDSYVFGAAVRAYARKS